MSLSEGKHLGHLKMQTLRFAAFATTMDTHPARALAAVGLGMNKATDSPEVALECHSESESDQ